VVIEAGSGDVAAGDVHRAFVGVDGNQSAAKPPRRIAEDQ
jgi:hypothetical protein